MLAARKAAKDEASEHRRKGNEFSRRVLHRQDALYQEAARVVHLNQQPDHNNPIIVTAVEHVYNAKLQTALLECKQAMIDPTAPPVYKFHGTSVDGVDGICKHGFRQPKAESPNMDKKSGGTKLPMYGHGIYFASDATKSAQKDYTQGSNMLLVCKILLGKSLTLRQPDNHLEKQKLHKKGYDSVFAPAGSAVRFDEYIVYDARQCIPEFIVHFGKGAPSAPAVPVNASGMRNLTIKDEDVLGVHVGGRQVDPLKEAHWHRANALFYRLLAASSAGNAGGQYIICQVDALSNPTLEKRFEATRVEFERKGKPTDTIWGFHGTQSQGAINGIMKDGLKVGGEDGVGVANGAACGKGVYFCEDPSVSFSYAGSTKCMFLCELLIGKVLQGRTNQNGFDSNHGGNIR
eukprot:3431241-Prymnesium_polylepis.1